MQATMPEAARRRFARTAVRAHAFVHRGRRFQRANVLDYSLGGLQLDGTFGLVTGDVVEVELICGARLRTRVAWSLGARTGAMFAQPLLDTHPAIVGLAHRARRTTAMDEAIRELRRGGR